MHLRVGRSVAFIVAISLGILCTISSAFYLSTYLRPDFQTYSHTNFELDLFAFVAIACAVGAIGFLVTGFIIEDETPKKAAKRIEEVPKYAGIEYPFEVIRLVYEAVVWPVYAQDLHPIMGEPLFAPGPKCPLCDDYLEDLSNPASTSDSHRWKCMSCRFAVERKESIEDASEIVQQIAYQQISEERKKRRKYFDELQQFLNAIQSSAAQSIIRNKARP